MIQVASYCRVSTDREDQANSFESQQRYFRAYIERQPEWTLYEVYADEGITGTSTRNRTAFNRMICDARTGKIQLIITKEVSRFSRNILDTIAYTRELKRLGVGVLFLNDAINTLEPDAELRLSILGSIAQEESRKTSSRVKWGQTRQMEQGVVFGRSLLGYDVQDGRLTVNQEGAAVVRLIFQKYGLEKKGSSVIARELREAGYVTSRGNPRWSASHVLKILKNEKYVGDLVQKKSITPDYLTHNKKRNCGEEALVVIRNHHTPIIDRRLWEMVQDEIKKRDRHGAQAAGHANRYVFSGKIKCGICGASFVSRTRKQKDGSECRYWRCYTAVNEGKQHIDSRGNRMGCSMGTSIHEELAMSMLNEVITSLKFDRSRIVRSVADLATDSVQCGKQNNPERLEWEIRQIMAKKGAVLDAFFSGNITEEEQRMMNVRYDRELTALRSRMSTDRPKTAVESDAAALQSKIRRQAASIINGEQFSEVFWKQLLDRIVFFSDSRIEVRLKCLPQTWLFTLEPGGSTGSWTPTEEFRPTASLTGLRESGTI